MTGPLSLHLPTTHAANSSALIILSTQFQAHVSLGSFAIGRTNVSARIDIVPSHPIPVGGKLKVQLPGAVSSMHLITPQSVALEAIELSKHTFVATLTDAKPVQYNAQEGILQKVVVHQYGAAAGADAFAPRYRGSIGSKRLERKGTEVKTEEECAAVCKRTLGCHVFGITSGTEPCIILKDGSKDLQQVLDSTKAQDCQTPAWLAGSSAAAPDLQLFQLTRGAPAASRYFVNDAPGQQCQGVCTCFDALRCHLIDRVVAETTKYAATFRASGCPMVRDLPSWHSMKSQELWTHMYQICFDAQQGIASGTPSDLLSGRAFTEGLVHIEWCVDLT